MTLFVPQTFTTTIPNSALEFQIVNNLNEFDKVKLKIKKSDIPHDDYLKIKNLTIEFKLLSNAYSKIKNIWEVYYQKPKYTNFSFKFNVSSDTYFIEQNIIPIADSFSVIQEQLQTLNPLFNSIEDLPPLKLQLLDNYIFENGFTDSLDFNITAVQGKKDSPNTYSYSGSAFKWSNYDFDFRNVFKPEIKVEYYTQRF